MQGASNRTTPQYSFMPSSTGYQQQLQQQGNINQPFPIMMGNATPMAAPTSIYDTLWRELQSPTAKERPAAFSSFIAEFIKSLRNVKKGHNIIQTSMPSIVLSGISLLEICARSFAPTRELLRAHKVQLPEDRMLCMLKYMFNACHFHYYENGYLRTKPYNPILGEQFKCSWNHSGQGGMGSTTYCVAEQVSHHPPCTAFYLENRDCNITLEGTMGVNVSLGFNKAVSNIFGPFTVTLHAANGGTEQYHYSRPTTVVNNLLIGKGNVRLNGELKMWCESTQCEGILQFDGNSTQLVGGRITRCGKVVYEILGGGDTFGTIKMVNKKQGDARVECFWNHKEDFEDVPINVKPLSEQVSVESRRVWYNCSIKLMQEDYTAATLLKNQIEQDQREKRQRMEQSGMEFRPQLFTATGNMVDTCPEYRLTALVAAKK